MIDVNNIVNANTPILVTVITGVITWGLTQGNKLIKAKISTENYTKLKNVGKNAWYIVEEYFRLHPELKTSIESKIIMFATEVRNKVPYVTDAEIETLRQAIAGEINKDKPVSSSTSTKAYDSPIQVTTTPENATNTNRSTEQTVQQGEVVIKYFTNDGIELKPVDSGSAATA